MTHTFLAKFISYSSLLLSSLSSHTGLLLFPLICQDNFWLQIFALFPLLGASSFSYLWGYHHEVFNVLLSEIAPLTPLPNRAFFPAILYSFSLCFLHCAYYFLILFVYMFIVHLPQCSLSREFILFFLSLVSRIGGFPGDSSSKEHAW